MTKLLAASAGLNTGRSMRKYDRPLPQTVQTVTVAVEQQN